MIYPISTKAVWGRRRPSDQAAGPSDESHPASPPTPPCACGPSGSSPAACGVIRTRPACRQAYPQYLRARRGLPPVGRRRPRIYRFHVRLGADGAGLRRSRCRSGRRCAAAARQRPERPDGAAGRTGRAAGRHRPPRRLGDVQKNGTDATTTCVIIARAATGRRKVLVARGAYHGAVPWCNPYPARRHARKIACMSFPTTTTMYRASTDAAESGEAISPASSSPPSSTTSARTMSCRRRRSPARRARSATRPARP